MRLTPADRLALMLTSARSQRALGAYLGISHQKIGRWIKGERINPQTGVVTNIPNAQDRAAIEAGYAAFKRAMRPGAHQTPVYIERLALTKGPRAGQPGLRAVIRPAHDMSEELFEQIMQEQFESGDFFEVMVMSEVDLLDYFKRGEEEYRKPGRVRTSRQEAYRDEFRKRIQEGRVTSMVYTKRQSLQVPAKQALNAVKRQLQQKHEPAATREGARLRTQVVFTLHPDETRRTKPKAKRPRRRSPPR